MKIAMAADHRGAKMIHQLAGSLRGDGHEVLVPFEMGLTQSCDYPDIAYQVTKSVMDGEADGGVLICGTGIGMSMAANKVKGIRAAVVHDQIGAEICKRHNNANVLCIGADMMGDHEMLGIVNKWIGATFEGGRHARRVAKIDAIERGEDPQTINEPMNEPMNETSNEASNSSVESK